MKLLTEHRGGSERAGIGPSADEISLTCDSHRHVCPRPLARFYRPLRKVRTRRRAQTPVARQITRQRPQTLPNRRCPGSTDACFDLLSSKSPSSNPSLSSESWLSSSPSESAKSLMGINDEIMFRKCVKNLKVFASGAQT